MKKYRKLFAILLVVIMTMGLAITASAVNTYTITINNPTSGHTYDAYQIFSGDLSSTGVLSNIDWGSGVSEEGKTALGNAATQAAALSTTADAATFAKKVAPYLTTTFSTSSYANNSYTISGLSAGYYLVKDHEGTVNGDDTYTNYILEVVKDVTATPKSSKPTVEKKVQDINDSNDGTIADNAWQDSADHDIGDSVPFKLTGTLPSNYDDYDTYTYIFHDTESTGLTFNPDSVVVKVNDSTISSGYTVVTTGLTDGCTFEVRFSNLKTLANVNKDSAITVEYTSTLNANAVLGSTGNPNEVYLEYSNNPTQSNTSGTGSNSETGKTNKDKVIVFTYKAVINKVDSDNKPLSGAEFTLKKKVDGNWKSIGVIKNGAGTTFTFTGLDDGLYQLTETTTPEGYNSIDPIYFNVTADHDVTSDDPTLNSLSANQADAEGNDLTSGIIATFSAALSTGSVTTNLVNSAGLTLPTTGGIGTRIFYIIGGVLMVGAVVFLIVKKRINHVDVE